MKKTTCSAGGKFLMGYAYNNFSKIAVA